jgi:hypothetical protein
MRRDHEANRTRQNGDTVPALHNCGPSPTSVYRTSPVGQLHALDLYREAQASTLLTPHDREDFVPQQANAPGAGNTHGGDAPMQTTPAIVVQTVGAVLSKLPCVEGVQRPSFTEHDALEAIRQLGRRLQQLGRLVPVHGLVSWMPRYGGTNPPLAHIRTGQPLPWLPPHSDEYDAAIRFAWLLCAYSYAAPPLVLFNRAPSLRYWRADGALQIRWLGQAQGGA